jgi:hypothetical protein
MPRGFSDFLSRVFKAERAVLDGIDHVARREYEARIAPAAAVDPAAAAPASVPAAPASTEKEPA